MLSIFYPFFNSELSDGFVIWQIFFFFLVPGGLELAKHGHNWHHLMSVIVLDLSGRLD